MSEPSLAEVLVKFVALGTAAVWLAGGLGDLFLGLTGRETASDWMRRNPEWFWQPAWAVLAVLAWLAVHLYYLPPRGH